jgi:hypothetical protein
MPAEAILCVNCGFHLGHGRVLKTRDAALDGRNQSKDPTRIWLYAALGTLVLGALVLGAVIWIASRPPSIIGKWTGHAAFDFHGLPVITDDISLTFRKDGTVTCSDGTSGPYSIKGDVIQMTLEKNDGGTVSISFDSKFKIERNWLTIEKYPFAPRPVSFQREENPTIEAPSGSFLPGPSGAFPTGRRR